MDSGHQVRQSYIGACRQFLDFKVEAREAEAHQIRTLYDNIKWDVMSEEEADRVLTLFHKLFK